MKRFRSVLSVLLALTMVFTCFAAFADDGDTTGVMTESTEREIVTNFSDVDPSTTVGKAVTELAIRGIINGRPDGTFGPDENITRAEFSAIIVRLNNMDMGLGSDAVTGFTDLDADENFKWARPYIKVVKDMGYMDGVGDNKFAAGDPVTFEQVVAVLMRMHGWGPTCDLEAQSTPNATWSYGYIHHANSEGLTRNAMSAQNEPTKAVTRGIVAILANNSRGIRDLEMVVDPDTGAVSYQPSSVSTSSGGSKGSNGSGSNSSSGKNDDNIINGIVTATYLAYIDDPEENLNRNEIVVGDEVYTIGKKCMETVDIYDLLGQRVKMVYDDMDDIITNISVTDYESTDIYSGYVGGSNKFYLGVDNGKIQYASNPDTFRTGSVALKGVVIYNGKLIEDFEAEDLDDPDSPYYFKNGVIEIAENGRYNFVKISNYDTYVVNGTSTRSNVDYITLKYKYDDDFVDNNNRIEMPVSDDADYFTFRRGSTNIAEKDNKRSELKAYDVLSVLRSPEDADGPTVLKIEVTRNSVNGQRVSSVSGDDDFMFLMGERYYEYNYEYGNFVKNEDEDVTALQRGSSGVNLYLDYIGQIAAVTVSDTGDNGSYAYGYLLSLLQDDSESDYDLELYIMESDGTRHERGTSTTIQIDGKRYDTDDEDILDVLEDSANEANESYLNTSAGNDVDNLQYQQPIRYKLNSKNLVTAIDTVANSNIDGNDLVLSARIDDSTTDDGLRQYNRSSGFAYDDEDGDEAHFVISSTTKIFFIPDDRTDFELYGKRTTSTFTSGNSYYVEAYNVGTTSSNRADVVFIYKMDDTMVFNSKSSFLIITDYGQNNDDEETITGYRGNYNGGGSVATTTTTVKLNYSQMNSDAREDYRSLGKGDIVRYLTGSDGRVTDLELWLDASDPIQDEPVGSVREALENRVLAIRSNSTEPVDGDAYNAAFRLAYGTVLRHETDIKSITVTPTLVEDDIEMVDSGTGVVAHLYSSSTKVFVYNGRSGAEYIDGEDAFEDIQAYEDGNDGSVVVTFSTGDTTNSASPFRMIYIIH